MNRGRSKWTSRPGRPSRAAARQLWFELLAASRRIGEAARRSDGHDDFDAVVFAALISGVERLPFPLQYASAQRAASAFLLIARAFAVVAQPEDRAAVGGFLMAGSICLDEILHAQAVRDAEPWQRRMGEI